MFATLQCLAALAAVAAASPGERLPSSGDYAAVSGCVVNLIDEVQLPARVAGALMSLQTEDGTPVREGLRVTKQQLLGRLDDADALARQKAARLDHQVAQSEETKSEAAIVAADATVEVARAEVKESEEINRKSKGSIPATTYRRQQLTEHRAKMESDVARKDAETAALTVQLRAAQLEVATLNVDRHRIEAPLDGTIVELYKHVGEWVNPGDPILRLVYLDRLRVQGFLNISSFLPEQVEGQPVRIEVLFGSRKETFDSTISYVSPLVEASGEYRVWAEIDNPMPSGRPLVRPGMQADMYILLKQPQATAQR